MRFLDLDQVLTLYRRIIKQSGGHSGIRDQAFLESSIAQPHMTYGGRDLYPMLIQKVVAFGFSLIKNHAFIDGNKRTAHAIMEVMLLMNGYELQTDVDT